MTSSITQNLYRNDSTIITVVECNYNAITKHHLQPLLDTAVEDRAFGISASYKTRCRLSSIAFSTLSHALVVDISGPTTGTDKRIVKIKRLLQECLLVNPQFRKYTFMMDQLAVALFLDLSICIDDAVDMLSYCKADRQSLQALMNAMGGEEKLEKKNVKSLFFGTSLDSADKMAMKAWAACRAATLPWMTSRFASIPRINTRTFPDEHLFALANISRHAALLDRLKPIAVQNDVKEDFTAKKDSINLLCERFSTRIRLSTNQVIRLETQNKDSTNQFTGRARKVDGRTALIKVDERVPSGKIISVTTLGKEDPTQAETTRQDIILKTLQGSTTILSNPFFQALWFAEERPLWPKLKGPRGEIPVCSPRELNPSQRKAVKKILSDKDEDRIVIIQGPPGTGKTTVITASVMSHDNVDSTRGIWVAAHSNVAVKNIAENLMKGGFDRFVILVSKDFHFDWHEHLYEQLNQRLIRSEIFPSSVVEAAKLLLNCKVILCTLSMFSHPRIDTFLRIVPVEMVVLDEASQIECGDYLPVFHRFQQTLSKVVLIGDDKQLPPYGQEHVSSLRSVFEFSHLRDRILFLDIQYRMPHVIGSFISENVYDGKLQTSHTLTMSLACRFIDVKNGQEVKQGRSWTNPAEANIVVKLARAYGSMKFRIITPYDAQRSLIENKLKSENLLWEDKVFNVDSFQGNEEDHIIISVVRSHRPGFLQSQRRTNVMLTRCKKSMIICSSRSFLLGAASETLVGKLATSMNKGNWIDARHVLQGGRIQTFA